MRLLTGILAFAIIALAVHRFYTERMHDAATVAADKARAAALRSKPPTPTPPPPALTAIALSRAIEPFYADLFATPDTQRPTDVVPALEIAKERVLDAKTHASEEKQRVFDHAIQLLTAMIALGEERTQALQSSLHGGGGALDVPTTTNTTKAFFAQGAMKRWEQESKRRKPVLDQLFGQLREGERLWNKRAGPDALVESYDLPPSDPVLITANESADYASPLEKGTYNDRKGYSWRRSFYDRYGYPRY